MGKYRNGVADILVDGQYATRPVLELRTLDAICEANLGFLTLIGGASRPADAATYGLAAPLTAATARLTPFSRRAVAAQPYTLFNLRFEDAEFWRQVMREAGRPGAGSLRDEATFARTAVFLAWHLVQGNELGPAMVLGMTPAVVDAWRGLPLSALDHAATHALPHLQARWAGNARFWPKLVAAAAADGGAQAEGLRELGLQLLAAQGLAGAGPRAEAPPAGAER